MTIFLWILGIIGVIYCIFTIFSWVDYSSTMKKAHEYFIPFIHETGSYYFSIEPYSDAYNKLTVFKNKIDFFKRVFLHKSTDVVGASGLITINYDSKDVKYKIEEVFKTLERKQQEEDKFNKGGSLDNWDGFVGEVPENVKQQIIRSTKLEDILKIKE